MNFMDFPLKYSIYGVRPRSRKDERVDLFEVVSLPIREVSPDDAPVAAKFSFKGHEEEIRWHDDKWWVRDLGTGGLSGELKSRAILAGDKARKWLSEGSFFLYREWPSTIEAFRQGDTKTLEQGYFREVRRDFREDQLFSLQNSINENLRMIDGVAYCAVPEPYLVAQIEEKSLLVSACFGPPHTDAYVNRIVYFGLGQHDEFMGLVENVAVRENLPIRQLIKAEHLYGPTTSVRKEIFYLKSAAQEFLGQRRGDLPAMNKAAAMAWYDLRDAVKALENRKTSEQLLSNLAATLSACDADGDIGVFARAAVDLWEMRPITEDSLSFGL